jgi:SAM-dependent methyltransferase
MHPTALKHGRLFFETYVAGRPAPTVVEIGSQDVNGSLRDVCPPGGSYVGLDFVAAKGVDVVLEDPYALPLPDASVDFVVSSSCFEHSELFWVLFLEAIRILKPNGLFYLNAPSNGAFHRYPVDCWRFYPDSGKALVAWARRNGYRTALLESFIGKQEHEQWSDCVAVFLKDEAALAEFPGRILHGYRDFENGLLYGSDRVFNWQDHPEDRRRLLNIAR